MWKCFYVEGSDPTPDGRHDYTLYRGQSLFQVFRAAWSGMRNGQNVVIRIFI